MFCEHTYTGYVVLTRPSGACGHQPAHGPAALEVCGNAPVGLYVDDEATPSLG